MSWKDEILKTHGEQTGYFKELEKMKTANNTIEDLDKKICKAVGVQYEDYKNMSLTEQSNVRGRYMLEVRNLKQVNEK